MAQDPAQQPPEDPSAGQLVLSQNVTSSEPREWPESIPQPHWVENPPRTEWRRMVRWGMWRFRETGEHMNLSTFQFPWWAADFPPFIPPSGKYKGPRVPTGYKPAPGGNDGEAPAEDFFKANKFEKLTEPPQPLTDWPFVAQAPREIVTFLENYYRLKFVKVLGWGGDGIAILFVHSREDGTWYFVAKAPIDQEGWDGLKREEAFQRKFTGAQHIVQLAPLEWFLQPDLEDLGMDLPLQLDLDNPRPPDVEVASAVMLSEFLPSGSLAKLINALNLKPHLKPVPNYFAWNIWLCMVRSLVEFKYSPQENKYDPGDGFPVSITFDDVISGKKDNIHFALDPANYIFGDRGVGWADDQHYIAPVLKMADFGASETIEQDVLFKNPFKMWGYRVRGKFSYWAPEQFSEEWDYVEALPHDILPPDHVVAGKYSWKLNLWQAAQSMVTLLTGMYPESPPIPTWMEFGQVEGWGYGAYVLEGLKPYVDPRLTNILARCMMENPDHRPDIGELQGEMVAILGHYRHLGQQEGNPDETDWPRNWHKAPYEEQTPWTDRQLHAWVDEALYQPASAPAPGVPPPADDGGLSPAQMEDAQVKDVQQELSESQREELFDKWADKKSQAFKNRLDAMQEAQAMKMYERWWNPALEKTETYKRQKEWKRWLKTRPPAEQEEVDAMSQAEQQAAFESWLARRVKDEEQERRLQAYIKHRDWKWEFNLLWASRPADHPPETYYSWVLQMAKMEATRPHTDAYIADCVEQINDYVKQQHQDMISQLDKRAERRIAEQRDIIRQSGQPDLTPLEIQVIRRYYDEDIPTYLPTLGTSLSRRIYRLQKEIFGQDWHIGKSSQMISPFRSIPSLVNQDRIVPYKHDDNPLPSSSPPLSRTPTPDPPRLDPAPGGGGGGKGDDDDDDDDSDDSGDGGAGDAADASDPSASGGGGGGGAPPPSVSNDDDGDDDVGMGGPAPAPQPQGPVSRFNPNAPVFNPSAPVFYPGPRVAPPPTGRPAPSAPPPPPPPEVDPYEVEFPALGTPGPVVPKRVVTTKIGQNDVKDARRARRANNQNLDRVSDPGVGPSTVSAAAPPAITITASSPTAPLAASPAVVIIQERMQEMGLAGPAAPPPQHFQAPHFGNPILPMPELENPRFGAPMLLPIGQPGTGLSLWDPDAAPARFAGTLPPGVPVPPQYRHLAQQQPLPPAPFPYGNPPQGAYGGPPVAGSSVPGPSAPGQQGRPRGRRPPFKPEPGRNSMPLPDGGRVDRWGNWFHDPQTTPPYVWRDPKIRPHSPTPPPPPPGMVLPPFPNWDSPWLDYVYPRDYVAPLVNGQPPTPKTKYDQYQKQRREEADKVREEDARREKEKKAREEQRAVMQARHQQRLRERQRQNQDYQPPDEGEGEISPRSLQAFRVWKKKNKRAERVRDARRERVLERGREIERERRMEEPPPPPPPNSPDALDFQRRLREVLQRRADRAQAAAERRATIADAQWRLEMERDHDPANIDRTKVGPPPQLTPPRPVTPLQGSPISPPSQRAGPFGPVGQDRVEHDPDSDMEDRPPPPRRERWWHTRSPYNQGGRNWMQSSSSDEDDNTILRSPSWFRRRQQQERALGARRQGDRVLSGRVRPQPERRSLLSRLVDFSTAITSPPRPGRWGVIGAIDGWSRNPGRTSNETGSPSRRRRDSGAPGGNLGVDIDALPRIESRTRTARPPPVPFGRPWVSLQRQQHRQRQQQQGGQQQQGDQDVVMTDVD